ncbi:MAG: hypothetical protein ACTHLW_10470 [Verrucomicrobiota bacterium]
MKKIILSSVSLLVLAAGTVRAETGNSLWTFAVTVNNAPLAPAPAPQYQPGYAVPAYSEVSPTVVYSATLAPVYYAATPAPVVMDRPSSVAPVPVLGFSFNFGDGHHRRVW